MVILMKIEETCWPMMVMLPGSPLKAEMRRFTHWRPATWNDHES